MQPTEKINAKVEEAIQYNLLLLLISVDDDAWRYKRTESRSLFCWSLYKYREMVPANHHEEDHKQSGLDIEKG